MPDTVLQDVKYAWRQLLKNPGFSSVVVVTLALGIGATTAIFSMVNGVLLQSLPYEDPDRLVLIRQQLPAAGVEDFPFSVLEISDYRNQTGTFEAVTEYHSMWFTLLGREEPQRVQTGVVSANFFDVLGTRPLLGRSFQPSDDELGAEAVLILSHRYWQQEFGGDPEIIGRVFEMNNRIHTVVGVLPPVPQYPDENHIYIPTSGCPFRSSENMRTKRNLRMMQVFGRLDPGVTLEQARADVALVSRRLAGQYPEEYDTAEGYSATVVPLRQEIVGGEAGPRLWILLGTVSLVLLITCANLANLMFARHVRRQREMAIRSALGADRARLIRLLLTESTLLALVGGVLGVALAAGVLELLIDFAGRFTARAGEITIDATVLVFALALSIVTGLAVGGMPALSSRGDLVAALREGSGRSTGSRGLRRLRNALIVAELAVSFVLLVGAGLMLRTLVELRSVNPGFDSRNVLTMQISLNWSRHTNQEEWREFFSRLLEEAGALPGVSSTAVSSTFPLNEATSMSNDFEIEGELLPQGRPKPRAEYRVVSVGYFDTLGVTLSSGRLFAETDHAQAPGVVLVNQTTARRYWDGRDPVGKRVSLDGGSSWRTIVGVVGDVRHHGLESEATGEIYLPFLQNPIRQMNFLVRSSGDPMALARPVREAVYAIDALQPVANVRSLDQVRSGSLASPRLTTTLLALFAGLALVITAAGLAGVIVFSVSQQTREIGVRMALGARRRQVLWTVLRGVLALVVAGLSAGVLGSLFLTRLMSSLLFGVEPNDITTLIAVALLFSAVAAVACLVPARRATLLDPVVTLRCD